MCAGTIDGIHVPIIAQADSNIEYVNAVIVLSCKQ